MPMRLWAKPRPALAPANTRASAIARRGNFTKRAYGYMDDRRCRPAALPPVPERARKAGKCSASPIPTGTTVSKAIDVEDLKSRGAAPAFCDDDDRSRHRNRRGYTLTSGSDCLSLMGSTSIWGSRRPAVM